MSSWITVYKTVTSAFLVMLLTPAVSNAAFFQIVENSASGLGNSFAGNAAVHEDASTVWSNPAAMSALEGTQFSLTGTLLSVSTGFSPASPPTTSSALGSVPISGGNGGNPGEVGLVPSFYYVQPLNDELTFGFGITAPYGLASDFDDQWYGRYHADSSEVLSVNLNPALSWKVSDRISLGAGLNAQYFDVTLTQAIDTGSLGAPAGLTPTMDDSKIRLQADDWSYGYNLGLFIQGSKRTRFGFTWRSSIEQDLTGNSSIKTSSNSVTDAMLPGSVAGFRAAAASMGLLPPDSDDITIKADLPATWSVSAYHQFPSNKWAVMGDITQTGWSSLPELRVNYASGAPDSVVTFDLEDSFRYSLGFTYFANEKWTWRMGIALDETPMPSAVNATPRLPAADRRWISFGFRYRCSQNSNLDFGYAYLDVKDAGIDKIAGPPGTENFASGNLVGEFTGQSINVLSIQFSKRF